VFEALRAWYISPMEQAYDPFIFTYDRSDWERIKRALIAYSASLEPDRSDAAETERQYALALHADIEFKL
jgi:hypothetical protein